MPRIKARGGEGVPQFDRMPIEDRVRRKAREILHSIAVAYGFEIMHTAVLEDAKLLAPVVKAGMLEERSPIGCKTAAGTDFMLRPSGALGILRAYQTQKMNDLPHPLKFSFEGESFFFSHARGHIRSVDEWGLIMVGEEGPIAEAEIIQVMWKSLEQFGFDQAKIQLRINAVGCVVCRPSFRSAFTGYFRQKAHRLCKNCKKHVKRSPLRILSCKEETCRMLSQNAPQVLDFLCEACKKHLRGVLEFLDEIRISYFLDSKFFNEGSLYNTILFHFVFSITTIVPPAPALPGEESGVGVSEGHAVPATIKESWTLAEGGRMSRAGELIVGRKLDVACGFIRLDDLVILCTKKESFALSPEYPQVFLAQLGDLAKRKSLGLIELLRLGGISLRESLGRDSIKSQLKVAERMGAEIALILGQKEALDKTIIVREIQFSNQETVAQDKLIEFLKRKLKK